jgi:hypothetical protein
VYALGQRPPRPLRRLMDRLAELTRQLEQEYLKKRPEGQ